VAGLVGGLVGTLLMNEYQRMWSRYVTGREPHTPGGKHDARDWEEKYEGNNANQQAAQAVARHTVGRELTDCELEVAAPIMHFAFGGFISAAYGVLVEHSPSAASGAGIGYGAAVWAGADELAMPFIGWSNPRRLPPEAHLQSFTAHLVFGLGTELTRRAVRTAIDVTAGVPGPTRPSL
jgi:hypothetical protein